MQAQYLGDSHDYAKYALLRRIEQNLGGPLGVNWYLTKREAVDKGGNNDGEKRHHLNGQWDGWEPDLKEQLRHLAIASERRIGRVVELGILPPSTIFFEDDVPTTGRAIWHRKALTKLGDASIVFLDPDNGMEVPSMSLRSSPKYAFYSEALDYFSAEKIVILIQFARQCDPINKAHMVRNRFASISGIDMHMPVIRARMAPNLLFCFLAPQPLREKLTTAIKSFANGREKIEIIP